MHLAGTVKGVAYGCAARSALKGVERPVQPSRSSRPAPGIGRQVRRRVATRARGTSRRMRLGGIAAARLRRRRRRRAAADPARRQRGARRQQRRLARREKRQDARRSSRAPRTSADSSGTTTGSGASRPAAASSSRSTREATSSAGRSRSRCRRARSPERRPRGDLGDRPARAGDGAPHRHEVRDDPADCAPRAEGREGSRAAERARASTRRRTPSG